MRETLSLWSDLMVDAKPHGKTCRPTLNSENLSYTYLYRFLSWVTDQLTPWSRVLFEKLTVPQLMRLKSFAAVVLLYKVFGFLSGVVVWSGTNLSGLLVCPINRVSSSASHWDPDNGTHKQSRNAGPWPNNGARWKPQNFYTTSSSAFPEKLSTFMEPERPMPSSQEPPLVPSLSQVNPDYNFPSWLFKIPS